MELLLGLFGMQSNQGHEKNGLEKDGDGFMRKRQENPAEKKLRRMKKILMIFLMFLSIHSAAGFMMFVSEEAMQTAMFGAFAYGGSKDYYGLKNHVEGYMIPVARTGETIIGIACAPGFLFCKAYLNYIKSNQGYIEAQIRLLEQNGIELDINY